MSVTKHDPNTPSIPISYTRLVARELGLTENSFSDLMCDTGFDGKCLANEKTLLSMGQQIQVIRNAIRISGEAQFGLRLGQLLTPPTHGPLGFLANSSPDLLTAIKAFQDYFPSRVSFARLSTRRKGGWLECHFHLDFDAEEVIYRCVIEAFCLSLLSMVAFVLGRPLTEGLVYCRYSKPAYSQLYGDYLCCPVEFSCAESMLLIPYALCSTPNASADHANYNFALKQCQQKLEQLSLGSNTARYLVQVMLLSHPPGQLSEKEAAAALFITPRTLARRLASEGTGFRQLRDESMSSLAVSYLQDTNLSVETIAGLLNYHDSANFRRAFKRWFNLSPTAFRRRY